MDATSQPPTEIFKALGDPVRWSIIAQMAAVRPDRKRRGARETAATQNVEEAIVLTW